MMMHTHVASNASVEVHHFDRGARELYNFMSFKKDKQRFLS
jgi:hypothetical protein